MNNRAKTAFTLVELLVVIAIVGILSGLIIVGMNSSVQQASVAKAQVFSASLRNSLMMNMFAEYKLDGDATDSWGGHAAGTVSGASIYSSCMQGSCYSFDGVDDYIELADAQDLRFNTGGTISVWIYPRTAGGATVARVFDKGTDTSATNGYMIYLNSAKAIYFTTSGGSAVGSANNKINFNQWQLFTVTFNSSGRKMYINGIDATSTGGGSTALPPDVAGVVRIGNRAGATDRTFDGYIDELRLFNAVIPTSQIKDIYFSGINNLLERGEITKKEYAQKIINSYE